MLLSNSDLLSPPAVNKSRDGEIDGGNVVCKEKHVAAVLAVSDIEYKSDAMKWGTTEQG